MRSTTREEIRQQSRREVREHMQLFVQLRWLTPQQADEVADAIASLTLAWAEGRVSDEEAAQRMQCLAEAMAYGRVDECRDKAANGD